MAYHEIACVVHVEPQWENALTGKYLQRLTHHFERASYKKVLYLTLEGDRIQSLHHMSERYYAEFFALSQVLMRHHTVEEHDWSYGWSDHYDHPDFGPDIIRFVGGHGDAYLYDYLKKLQREHVKVMGGHRDECLFDLIQSLDHLRIRYERIPHLIY